MKVIVTVVEKITSVAHIDIPDGMSEFAIKQHITDIYKNGKILIDLNIYSVDFESLSAQIVKDQFPNTSISA